MISKSLLNYLRTILKLETDLRTLSVAMHRNRQQASHLSQTYTIQRPETNYFGTGIPGFFCDLLMSFIISIIPFGIAASFFFLYYVSKSGLAFVFGFPVALVGVAIFGAGMSNAKEERKQAPEKLRQYEKDVAENERQMQANRKALALVDQDYDVLRQRYNKATSLLQKYYDLNIIYPKYRGIVPVAMFVQYLESGIVYQLEGPNGAYSRYEDELFRQLIINKLDVIVTRLDDIRSTQYELANSLEKSNQQIMELNSHAEIQAYNTMQTNAEVKALKDYTIFRDLLR